MIHRNHFVHFFQYLKKYYAFLSRIGILPVVDDLIGTKLEKSILDNSKDSESKRISSAADLFLRIIGVDIEVHASPHYRVFVFFFFWKKKYFIEET